MVPRCAPPALSFYFGSEKDGSREPASSLGALPGPWRRRPRHWRAHAAALYIYMPPGAHGSAASGAVRWRRAAAAGRASLQRTLQSTNPPLGRRPRSHRPPPAPAARPRPHGAAARGAPWPQLSHMRTAFWEDGPRGPSYHPPPRPAPWNRTPQHCHAAAPLARRHGRPPALARPRGPPRTPPRGGAGAALRVRATPRAPLSTGLMRDEVLRRRL
ncbi:MAG: hypothetical protein J3K34DRAFT_134861 [Monoraphidium minutum]|nr:MAG: hypothetical protein J3K34DRAFT_134861 [Monoraphidium minutum]